MTLIPGLFLVPILVSAFVLYGIIFMRREAWALGAVNMVFWAALNHSRGQTDLALFNVLLFLPLYMAGWWVWGGGLDRLRAHRRRGRR